MFKFIFILFILGLISTFISAQEVDIVAYLKQIESGQRQAALDKLQDLKNEYPNDPSVLFLEGVLTENGQNAVVIYKQVYNQYPKSKYADASVYRIYSYYYALGLYQSAQTYLDLLKKDYPGSPYLKIAEKKMPAKDEMTSEDKVAKQPPPAKKEEQEKPVKKNLDYKFTIQAGAFSNADNALALKKKFEDAGFFSEVKEKNVAGTNFHIVYIGKFLTEDQAKNFLDVINSRFSLDGRIVPIE
jgi:septal ring-binding cell division protein DamX